LPLVGARLQAHDSLGQMTSHPRGGAITVSAHARAFAITAAVAAAVLLLPAVASAGTVAFDGERLTYTAAPGEQNAVYLTQGVDDFGPFVQIADSKQISRQGTVPAARRTGTASRARSSAIWLR
jgi:hypothetical protein